MTTDWREWHTPYADPTSSLSRRLAVVQESLAAALYRAPGGRVRLVSACAGQGHDVIGVLPTHPRAADVDALLVEYDAGNAAAARQAAADAGLDRVEVVTGDAGVTDAYAGAVPADVVLMCGVFGNVPDGDVERTARALPSLCAPGATVIWTRHRGAPDPHAGDPRLAGRVGLHRARLRGSGGRAVLGRDARADGRVGAVRPGGPAVRVRPDVRRRHLTSQPPGRQRCPTA
jgi:hypothetical protein